MAAAAAIGPGLVRAAGSVADQLAPPIGGSPDGDVTMVAFFDYECPYCKKASAVVQSFVASDRRIRLVYKDWPVLGDASVVAAKLGLTAAYQGRYEAAHLALMGLAGRHSLDDRMREAVLGAGIDMARLDSDAKTNAESIAGLLRHNAADAASLGLTAIPTFLVGGLRVVGGFDVENFQDFAARARAAR